MNFKNYGQFKIVKEKMQEKISKAYPDIKNKTGIYMFYRIVGYIGQSQEVDGILGRVATHCIKHDSHLDNSIHSRKLSCDGGQWHIKPLCYCSSSEVDAMEQKFIAEHIKNGVELYNITSGSQGVGKEDIAPRKERGGWNKGKQEGYKKAYKEISDIISKYTNGLESKGGTIADRKTAELIEKLNEVKNNESSKI